MEHLAKLFVSLVELAESELESLKGGVIRLALSLVLLIVAGVTGAVGVILLLAAGFWLLHGLLGYTWALAISGALFLGVTAVLAFVALRRSKKIPLPTAAETAAGHLRLIAVMNKSHPFASPPDARVAQAKANLLAAAYASSPLRAVEKHPLLSTAAVASVAMAVTVVAGEPLVRSVCSGVATHGLGIVNSLLRAPWAAALLQRFVPTTQPDQPSTTPL